MGEKGESGTGKVVFMNGGGGGLSNITNTVHTHTSSNKTLEACMDLSKYTHSHRCTHTFHSVELNLSASRDGAVELFMAARLQARL